jgi:hypothetical protein
MPGRRGQGERAVVMRRRLGRQRALGRIERDLADSDQRLDDLFFSFNERARGGKMPRTEKIRTGPFGLITRIGGHVRPAPDDFDRLSAWWL